MIRARWARIQLFGRVRYITLGTAALWVWITLCWLGFMFALGNTRVLHIAFVWCATLPILAVLSFAAMLCHYYLLRIYVHRLNAAN